ncbi:unnamed protein product [Vitrella brassicaformis CCMP3155]|uniref:C2 Aida-type domain-containing protein n=1 Tax=Vitrella brassicaformis (strain CCMP3155) TaxID=1169540 RepID=A0A0G4FXP9_VITBC|nr:unnamed protein product [Vitrella brassicaformis CCMP3155]|mmetsp:Transcript_18925/g.45597  ORF Transcript_18925/g.45597 Transcript_18925/m.45597 type:complete len:293 (-) Transcript_18925:214-1092(-)|eukprot:CEM20092.1 unnamed protein product [Vitrella brassicaformis CCMP3155]
MSVSTEKGYIGREWAEKFRQRVQEDSWGQLLEAQEGYTDLASVMAAKQGRIYLTSEEQDLMHRLILCLSARAQSLRTMREIVSLQDMKALIPVFETLFSSDKAPFSVEPHKYANVQPVRPSTAGEIICGDTDEPYSDFQHVSQALQKVQGTLVAIKIDKIGLKDAQTYINPFMTVLIAENKNQIVLSSHDTPVATERTDDYVVFGCTVYLGLSLEDMQRKDCSIFFEFKHYKPKKHKVSTRCWSLMEINELRRDEEIVLEIYHKPTDLRKKRIRLHSEKQLYLHLVATFITK